MDSILTIRCTPSVIYEGNRLTEMPQLDERRPSEQRLQTRKFGATPNRKSPVKETVSKETGRRCGVLAGLNV